MSTQTGLSDRCHHSAWVCQWLPPHPSGYSSDPFAHTCLCLPSLPQATQAARPDLSTSPHDPKPLLSRARLLHALWSPGSRRAGPPPSTAPGPFHPEPTLPRKASVPVALPAPHRAVGASHRGLPNTESAWALAASRPLPGSAGFPEAYPRSEGHPEVTGCQRTSGTDKETNTEVR